jgi:hypothetical protein
VDNGPPATDSPDKDAAMTLKTLFRLLFVLTLATLVALAVVDSGLRGPASPNGMMSFEFCGFTGRCTAILSAWGESGRNLAMFSLGLDYLFLLLYPGLICVALLCVARELPAAPALKARRLAALAWLMALADALENFHLLQVIRSGAAGAHGEWAGYFASVKFAVLFLALVALYRYWRRTREQMPAEE